MAVATSKRNRVLALLAGVIIGVFGLFLLPGSASAHAALISTNPVAGSVVPTAPSQIVITFSEHVTPVQSKISVIGPNEKKIDSGIAISIGDQLRIPINAHVPNGTYLVSYRVISADTHPVAFGFYYSVGAPSAGGVPKAIGSDSTNAVVATAVSVFQFIGFAGLCLVVGPALVLVALWPRRLDRTAPIRLAYTGLGAVAFASLAGLYLQAPYGQGTSLFGVTGADISDVLETTFGRAMMVRLALVVLAWFLLRPVLAGRGTRTDHVLLAGVGVVGAGTWAFAGHPAASSVPPLTVIADAAHLISVSIWIGGLVMLAAFLLRKADERELDAILPVWSNWATLAVAVLVLGGTTQALIEIGSISALLHTTYGQLVLVKIGILAVILLVAQSARRMVQRHAGIGAAPAADGDTREPIAAGVGAVALAGGQGGGITGWDVGADGGDGGGGEGSDGDEGEWDDEPGDEAPAGMIPSRIKRLRKSVIIELALAVAVLIATSILVQSSPVQNASGVTTNSQGTVTMTSSLYTIQVDFLPSGSGTDLHIYAYNAAGGPQPVQSMSIVATSDADGGLTQDLGVAKITDSHWTSTAVLPVGGEWTFTFTVRTTAVDEASVSTTQDISQ